MKKILIMIVLGTAMLLATAGNAFADGHRGGWGYRGDGGFRHQESRHEFRGDFHRGYYRDFRYREVWIAPPCGDRVIVYPPRAAVIIGPFAIFGF
jgi:hypothetical protein